MIEGRCVVRWGATAVLIMLAGCSLVRPTEEETPPPEVPPQAPASTPVPAAQPAPLKVTPRPAADGLGHVALIMPLSGRLASAGSAVREGFMTAFFQSPPPQRLDVRLYDTAAIGIAAALAQATQDGAQLIVGPLTREDVTAAAALGGARAPVLALNFLAPDHVVPPGFYQFALSPEDEARQVARRVLADGHKNGVALVPTGEWGTRVLAAFNQELQAGGGALLSQASFEPARNDYAPEITDVLRISDSRARAKRLESVLGSKLEYQPRLRGDIEFIFAAAQANIERLLLPQLRFHFAGGIATYATSDAFEPHPSANQDLEGLLFPDMPWMLGGELADSVRDAARAAWPTAGPARGRLYAFGFDAYLLAAALHSPAGGNIDVQGLTGRLSFDTEHRVHRELVWGTVHNGQPRVLATLAGADSAH